MNKIRFVIEVSDFGVERVRIPYKTLADQSVARELHARCEASIKLLDEVVRGVETAGQVYQRQMSRVL